ncbi:MAG: hypothetical protein M3Q29_06870 [Chloroflexota bacterium]|nr:hypothetical protein [Chloroflexota bacterium]
MSADGRWVVFDSDASNLVSGDTNEATDCFIRSLVSGKTTRVSISSSGAQGNDFSLCYSVSSTGRFVAFGSRAANLVAGDTNADSKGNHGWDIFVHDRDKDADGIFDEAGAVATTRENVSSSGTQANNSYFDMSRPAVMSASGRYVAFSSMATNLVTGDTNGGEIGQDVFVRDRQLRKTVRVSLSSGNAQGNGNSWSPAISANGRFVTFISVASNLVSGDTNNDADILVRDRDKDVDGIYDEAGAVATI